MTESESDTGRIVKVKDSIHTALHYHGGNELIDRLTLVDVSTAARWNRRAQ